MFKMVIAHVNNEHVIGDYSSNARNVYLLQRVKQ